MSAKYVADTNILVRLLTRDDDKQVHAIVRLIEEQDIRLFITSIAAIETYWVLTSVYKFSKLQTVQALISLSEVEEAEFEEKELVHALHLFECTKVDLVDIYLSERSRSLKLPALTWNRRDFAKLHGEFYTPDQLLE